MPTVAFLLLEGVHLLDLSGPAQVFYSATDLGQPYTLRYCSPKSEVKSAQGLHLAQLEPLCDLEAGDTVMVVGVRTGQQFQHLTKPDERTLEWLRQQAKRGVQMASICSGAVVLAEAGLLNHKKCTTHHLLTQTLQSRYPALKVQENVLFVRDGNLITSAGIASGIDMALFLLEERHGAEFVARVAQELVVYLRRNGEQSQESLYLSYRAHPHAGVHRVQNFLLETPQQNHSLERLSDVAHLSPRSLTRAFKTHTGLTPHQFQQRIRLERAKSLLQSPEFSIEKVALECGFQDARQLRRLWKQFFDSSPKMARA
jgi:transcriptional regulator GlxA family with amidase domain